MNRRFPVLTFFALLVAAGCSDPVALSFDSVAGDYTATTLTVDGDDILAAGGTLTMSLGSDGVVSGALTLPASAGGPLDADLDGIYTVNGSTLTFLQAADTFVRDATWTWADGVLSGEWSGASGSVSVRMTRS